METGRKTMRPSVQRRPKRFDCVKSRRVDWNTGYCWKTTQGRPGLHDISDDRLLDGFGEALSAGIIEKLPGTSRRYQFTHSLTQETLLVSYLLPGGHRCTPASRWRWRGFMETGRKTMRPSVYHRPVIVSPGSGHWRTRWVGRYGVTLVPAPWFMES